MIRHARAALVAAAMIAGAHAHAQEASPAQAPQVFDIVPGLQTALTIRYPDGQRPSWAVVEPGVVSSDATIANAQGQSRTEPRAMFLTSVDGRPVFVFEYLDGAACAFDFMTTPSAPLQTGVATTFALGRSRLYTRQPFERNPRPQSEAEQMINAQGWRDLAVGPPAQLTPGNPCGVGMFGLGRWGGELTITPAGNGDLTLSATINQLGSGDSVKSSARTGDIKVANRTPPRAPSEVIARAATPSTPDGVLPPIDASAIAAPAGRVRSVQVNLRSIDDLGFAMVAQPTGELVEVASAEWMAGRGMGAASGDVTSKLRRGVNMLIVGVHNKYFQFGVGKWAYDIEVVADGARVWRGAELRREPGVGIRFWKALAITLAADGAITVAAPNAEQTARLTRAMGVFNEDLVKHFGTEQSTMALVGGVLIMGMLSDMGSSGGGSRGGGYNPLEDPRYYQHQNSGGGAPPSRPDTSVGCAWGDRAYGTC